MTIRFVYRETQNMREQRTLLRTVVNDWEIVPGWGQLRTNFLHQCPHKVVWVVIEQVLHMIEPCTNTFHDALIV